MIEDTLNVFPGGCYTLQNLTEDQFEEINDWIVENTSKYGFSCWSGKSDLQDFRVCFSNEQDGIHFKLRWSDIANPQI